MAIQQLLLGTGPKGYEIERSLRFNDDDSTYIQRVSSTGNTKTWTVSFWMKFCEVSGATNQRLWSCDGNSGTYNMFKIEFYGGSDANRRLAFLDDNHASSGVRFTTNRCFRDPNAWYHIVLAVDTTQATASNRVKIYVNGEQETEWLSGSEHNHQPDQDYSTSVNANLKTHTWGRSYSFGSTSADYFDGYLAEINFIDGSQLTPSSFAKTHSKTGQWVPKKYSGTYGTNGYHLTFSDNSNTTSTTLGKDSSGNGNNFTCNNFSVADGIDGDSFADTPTNNFCTLNLLVKSNDSQSLSNGNLTRSGGAKKCMGTILLTNNKYYFEYKAADNNGNHGVGVTQHDTDTRDRENSEAAAYFANGEYKIESNGQTSGFSSYGTNDIIGVAIDTTLATPKVWFAKNNTWQGTGDPSTAGYSLTAGKQYVFNVDHCSGGSSTSGTAFFGAHKGEFNYTPPTGFVAACSANLPDPTIKIPDKHFESEIYTPNSGNLSVTGFEFQPDLLWLKSRTQGYRHYWFDSVRGTGQKALSSDRTSAEGDDAGSLTSFDSTGFTTSGSSGFNDNGSGTDGAIAWAWNAGDTETKTYTVTVVDSGGNKFRFDGYNANAVTLDLAEGGTYVFNYPSAHPLRFSTTSDGTHGGGSEYTTGVTHNSSTQVTLVVASGAPNLYYYCANHSGMGGFVRTNIEAGSSNFDGGIISDVKANPTAGFSIVGWTGTNGNGTLGHGLGVAPQVIIMKGRNVTDQWTVGHHKLDASNPWHKGIPLNTNASTQDNSGFWNDTAPTSTVFSKGTWNDGYNMVAYCFSEVAGFSHFGKYTGNGSSNGTFVYTGFRPAMIISKTTNHTDGWQIWDNKRDPDNLMHYRLHPEDSAVESTSVNSNSSQLDFCSNGFKWKGSSNDTNGNGDTYIYMAFAEAPFKYSRAR